MKNLLIVFSLFIIVTVYSCKKDNPKILPTVSASAITSITANSATAGGEVSNEGSSNVTSRGICWSSTNTTPTLFDSKTTDGSGLGIFSSSLTGLTPGTTYNVRAYATNSVGTSYYSQAPFKTLATSPALTTTDITSVTTYSFNTGGIITNNGGADITSRGVCWSLIENPTISDNKTSDGSGIGTFASPITGLNPGTTYYVRAYATNSAGTSYGNQLAIKTITALPTIVTVLITNITSSSGKGGGNITSDGGGSVIAKGICWSKTSNPTIADNKTTDGRGSGSYYSQMTGLTEKTTYYVRAYATNSVGTSYGNQLDFTTTPYQPTDFEGNTYSTVTIGTQLWMQDNLKSTKYNDGTPIPLVTDNYSWTNTSQGYCWYNNDAATYKDTYGAMYNWYAVNTGKLCPIGWHVPSNQDWIILSDYLGSLLVAADKLKEMGTLHWNSPNEGATNESKFTALPGGYRSGNDGAFFSVKDNGTWWSSTSTNSTTAWMRCITLYETRNLRVISGDMRYGGSVRCIKDN
jgi:uncharacterized protein (TIGR02145 family)